MIVRRYIFYGFAFGLSFPLGAWLLDVFFSRLSWSFESIVQIHKHNYLHWIIDSAPVVLSGMGWIIGIQQQKIHHYSVSLENTIEKRTAELEQSLIMETYANRAKSDFLAYMSHELRTPLNAILGFSQLLELEDLSEEQHDYVHEILTAGEHLLRLIQDVLDLGHIEAGKLTLDMTDVLVAPACQECISLIKSFAEQRQIKIINLIPVDIDYSIQADKFRFKQILLNLLSNAVKYNKDNGTITLSIELNHQRLKINIADTGIGLSKEQQHNLFQAFERLGMEKKSIQGNGIGLIICKNLIELMKGSINLESEVGIGSVFGLEFELVKPIDLKHERVERID